ncbi:MAG: 50S ribosomal protein L22, partial [Bacillota bacterium]|nr:50S ribosomal protein L22 [Bacillota bacterium]
MEVKATAKTVRIAPRKVRLVLDLVRGKDVEEALNILKFTPNHAAVQVSKVVKSAMANATNNHDLDENKLYIKSCYANEGLTLKRYRARAKGSASQILKRTSH